MLYKTIAKQDFEHLIEVLLAEIECIAPRKVETCAPEKPLYQFLPVNAFGDISFEYDTTEYSAKTHFLPFRETLSTFRFDDTDWTQTIFVSRLHGLCRVQTALCLMHHGKRPTLPGAITRGGCNAPCAAGGIGCWGCRGPESDPNYASFFAIAEEKGFSRNDVAERMGFYSAFQEVQAK